MGKNVDQSNEEHTAAGNGRKIHVLIVDDERLTRSLLKLSLQRMGYDVTTAANGEKGLILFQELSFDLVLLDILMPGTDGFAVCSELRKLSDVPIIMLTALNRPDDIVRGLALGADNYITKPFVFKEVEARIHALLRRTTGNPKVRKAQILEHGDVRLDSGMRAASIAGELVELTRTEYQLLHHLMTHVNQPVSKDTLIEEVWDCEAADINLNMVELAVRRLRKKVEEDPSNPQRLITVRGIGYKFVPQEIRPRREAQQPVHHRRAEYGPHSTSPHYRYGPEPDPEMDEEEIS